MAISRDQEFKDIMDDFQLHHEDANYDALPTLTKIAEALEWANDEYFNNNPDPLDTRNPIKVLPTCSLGHMLRHMDRNTVMIEKSMTTYLMPHQRREVNVMSARILVSSLSILDHASFTGDAIKELYDYALTSESRELRAYSTILLAAGITPENAHTYKIKLCELLTTSLVRLQELYDEMVDRSRIDKNSQKAPTDFSQIRNAELSRTNDEQANDVSATSSEQLKRRYKRSAERKCKRSAQRKHKRTISMIVDDKPSVSFESVNLTTSPTNRKRPHSTNTDTSPNGVVAKRDRVEVKQSVNRLQNEANSHCNYLDHEVSNASTVNDLRRVLIGENKIYPLTIEMEQRMILQYIQTVCEFVDHLSILHENKALEVVMKYLNMNEYGDYRLLFEAIYCIGTMLVHLRLAWDFVNMEGIAKLIKVKPESVAAAAVCVCLNNLGQFDDLMAHVCQSPAALLDDIVNYAILQLNTGYESSRTRICSFFDDALKFKIFLDRFDKNDGLRALYNYASAQLNEYVSSDELSDYERHQEKMAEYNSILKSTCTTLLRYLKSQVLLRYETIKRQNPNLALPNVTFHFSSYKMALRDLVQKPLILEPNVEKKALDLLLNYLPASGGWRPISTIRHLGFVNLLLRHLGVSTLAEYNAIHMKPEVARLCVNIIRFASVSPGIIRDMCDKVEFKTESGTGISILFDLLDFELLEEPELNKLALRTLVHCFCGPKPSELSSAVNYDKLRSPSDTSKSSAHRRNKYPRFNSESSAKQEATLMRAWQCAQDCDAIMVLIGFIRLTSPLTEADSIRTIACQALAGLSRCDVIRQIVSRLPFIANNDIAMLIREPISQDKQMEHAEFRQVACQLLQLIHQTPLDSRLQDFTLEKVWKTSVINQTKIRFDEMELLKLIQEHLVEKGLLKTAAALEQEAGSLTHLSVTVPTSLSSRKNLNIENGNAESPNLEDCSGDTSSDPVASSSRTVTFNDDVMEVSTNSSCQGTLHSDLSPLRLPLPINEKTKNKPAFSAMRRSTLRGRTFAKFQRRSTGNSSLLAQPSLSYNSRYIENSVPMTRQLYKLRPQLSLNEVVTEYFRYQHAACDKPIVTCPQFSFYYSHSCPKPKGSFEVPLNMIERLVMRQNMPYLRTHTMLNRSDRNMVFSHYTPVRSVDVDDERLSTCNFSHNDNHIHLGTQNGELHWINTETATDESSISCHSSFLSSVNTSPDGTLLLSSSLFVNPLTTLWRLGETQDRIYDFDNIYDTQFGNASQERLIGTDMFTGYVYDTETKAELCKFYDLTACNRYERNRARFNYNDTMVLNDGVLWDIRANWTIEKVHKFDKLCHEYATEFHPNGLEVLICGQVWDLRTYGLVKSVNALDLCQYKFNASGDILFAVKYLDEMEDRILTHYEPSFRVLDSKDYHLITTVDTKRELLGFAVDHNDRYICTIEETRRMDVEQTICRIYEIGRVRDETIEGESESDVDSDDSGELAFGQRIYEDSVDIADLLDYESYVTPNSNSVSSSSSNDTVYYQLNNDNVVDEDNENSSDLDEEEGEDGNTEDAEYEDYEYEDVEYEDDEDS
ncbi:LisH protein [Aphelenchoides besseyi]|nr:LisH protein [Aphelenchoides besseyi]